MTTSAAMKKAGPPGIEEIISQYEPGRVIEEKVITTVGDNPFAELLGKYRTYLQYNPADNEERKVDCIRAKAREALGTTSV